MVVRFLAPFEVLMRAAIVLLTGLLGLVLLGSTGVEAAPQAPDLGATDAGASVLYAYTVRYQPAEDALELVRPMLTAAGSVHLDAAKATLEIRDTAASTQGIATVLRSFDHPPLTLDLDIMVVRAGSYPVSPPPTLAPEIPADLVERWRSLLRYEHYQLMARAELEPKEGQEVVYDMGAGYRVSFRLGTLLANRRIKLHNFRLARTAGGGVQELIHTNLNPWLNQTTSLGLARDEASRSALMVVVVCQNPRAEATPEQRPPKAGGKESP